MDTRNGDSTSLEQTYVITSPGGGHDSPPHYSCLEHPMDRGAWGVMVHRAAKSQTRPRQLSPCYTRRQGCLSTSRARCLRSPGPEVPASPHTTFPLTDSSERHCRAGPSEAPRGPTLATATEEAQTPRRPH